MSITPWNNFSKPVIFSSLNSEVTPMDFGEKIFQVRTQLKMSQAKFAKFVGKSQPTIHNWETGGRMPRYVEVIKLKELFAKNGIEIEWI
jgi:DNA-binding transcriptional regulator YiaG